FASAHDIVGIRVTTFHSAEIEQLLAAVSTIFAIDTVVDKAAETAKSGRFGYASHHVIGYSSQLGRRVEVQLRTVLQHAWAEFEHDMRYKNPEMSGNPVVDRAFTLAAGLIELADEQFDKIARIVDARTLEQDATELDTRSLPGLLTRLLGSSYPTSRADYYGWAIAMLAAHGITTVAELKALLDPDRLAALHEAMAYPFERGQVRLIDDLLLFTYGRDHIRRTVDIGEHVGTRAGRLGNRWQHLRQHGDPAGARPQPNSVMPLVAHELIQLAALLLRGPPGPGVPPRHGGDGLLGRRWRRVVDISFLRHRRPHPPMQQLRD